MASQAAYGVEKAVGHDSNAVTAQDVSTYEPNNGETMLALVWKGKNKVEMARVPKPTILEDKDVILKVTGSTVCGSDLHLLHGSVVQMSSGDILGHEFCGVVEQVGSGVTKVKPGKRYVASFQIACGDCFYCQRKLSSQCERTNANTMEKAMYGGRTAGMFGYSHFTGGFAGGQAEYVRVPQGDVNLLEIPDDVPDEKGEYPARSKNWADMQALYLSDVLATSYHCVKDTGVERDDTVAVFGAGPIGQMAGIFALNEGAGKVIFVDTEPRLSFVRDHLPQQYAPKVSFLDYKNLSHGITSQETVVSELKKFSAGRGIDVALECAAGEYAKGWIHWLEMATGVETDTSEILNEMVESVRSYGRCGVTGIYVGYTNHFNVGSLMQRGVRLIGNGQAPVHLYWENLLASIKSGELDPLQMVSHRVRLEDLVQVYKDFEARQDGMQKVYVETRFSQPAAQGCPPLQTY